jgi:thioredoxin 1
VTARVADRDELRAAIAAGGRLLVEFWAPWCVQCAPMERVVERVAQTLPPDVAVLKVSVEDEAVAEEFSVDALPALQLFVDGRAAASITGFQRPPAVMSQLRVHLAAQAE